MATLHVCGQGTRFGALHPCARAARALDEAGVEYTLATAPGYRRLPGGSAKREGIRRISGQSGVPVLETDAGEVVSGSGEIVRWARDRG